MRTDVRWVGGFDPWPPATAAGPPQTSPPPGEPASWPVREVLVFKTSVTCSRHVARLSAGLALFGRWNFDLPDCDHVLRIEGYANHIPAVINFLRQQGFRCEELPD